MAQPPRMHVPAAMHAPAPPAVPAAQADVFGNPIPAHGHAPMMAPPPAAPPAIGMHNAYGAPPQPAMNPAGLMTQTGFHNASLAGAASQHAPQYAAPQIQQPPQVAGQASLHMSQRPIASGASANSARQAAPPPRPKTAPRPPAPAPGKPLEGTRFRPRNQGGARQEPRATPTPGGKSRQATWMLVAVGVAVAGVLVWVATSFF